MTVTITKLSDCTSRYDDPSMRAPKEISQAMRQGQPPLKFMTRHGEGFIAFEEEKLDWWPGRQQDPSDWFSSCFALHWFLRGEKGKTARVLWSQTNQSSPQQLDIDWAELRTLARVLTDRNNSTYAEIDLSRGTITPLHFDPRCLSSANYLGYLQDSRILTSSWRDLFLCQREGDVLRPLSAQPLPNSGFGILNGKLILAGHETTRLLGVHGDDVRLLSESQGSARHISASEGAFRFYNETGCYELRGAQELWEDCFVRGNRDAYPSLFQEQT